jgi:hypothetical protein
MLVDKSPSYVLDFACLDKAERDFNNPVYIHLVRHPYAMVRSFESYHMDQVLFLKSQPFSPRQLGELVWLISHRNTTKFLNTIPKNRQYCIRFEDLVNQPLETMETLCRTLGLTFHSDMLTPYDDVHKKMTDGIFKDSKPMGDTNFFKHQNINPKVAESWKGVLGDNFLSDITWELASSLGYQHPDSADRLVKNEPHTIRNRPAKNRRAFLKQSRQRRQRNRNEQ